MAAEPWVVFGNRPVAIDAYDAAGEVAANVGILSEIVVDAVEVRIIEAKPVGAGDEERGVSTDDNAALGALGQNVDVL